MAILFGDTSGSLTGRQHGGAQTLVGSDPTNTLFGDAGVSYRQILVTAGAGQAAAVMG